MVVLRHLRAFMPLNLTDPLQALSEKPKSTHCIALVFSKQSSTPIMLTSRGAHTPIQPMTHPSKWPADDLR